jgi:manganese/iron transport system ATP-binding protein
MVEAGTVEHDRSAPPLVVEHLTAGYNGAAALSDVTFTVPGGARVAVVGPNGAGKTTLLKMIAGALKPSSGRVQVYGHRPLSHICIAYVPQRSQIDVGFPVTVREVVMMGRIRRIGLFRWPGRRDWEEVEQALRRVGLVDLGDRQIGELSGGQQQRTFLAQALAQRAELILLDEPLTGLDTPSQEAIFRLLDELRQQGVPALVATHDLNMAVERFDRVLLLNRRLIAYGSPQEVLTRAHLLHAYGGHMHLLPDSDGVMVLTDTCCEGEEPET